MARTGRAKKKRGDPAKRKESVDGRTTGGGPGADVNQGSRVHLWDEREVL